jgi:hypothetical protein
VLLPRPRPNKSPRITSFTSRGMLLGLCWESLFIQVTLYNIIKPKGSCYRSFIWRRPPGLLWAAPDADLGPVS